MAPSPHRVPILATAVQEELEKEVVMEATPCDAAAQVSQVPRTSRGAGTSHLSPLISSLQGPASTSPQGLLVAFRSAAELCT